RLQLPGNGGVITFSADGTLFAAGTSNAWVRVWRVADAQLLADVGGFDTPITQIAISRDNATVVSVNIGCHLCGGSVEQHGPDKPKQVRIWRIADGALLQTITPMMEFYPVGFTS